MKKAILFDMDGVLVDSEAFIAQAAIAMFAEKGVHVKEEDFHAFIGMGEDRYLGGVAEKYGVSLSMPADKVRTYKIYGEQVAGKLQAMPGVKKFVLQCRSQGLKLAVASSADRMKVNRNLKEIGLADGVFDAIITGEDIVNKKPAPDIFLAAALAVGVNPSDAMVIEDAISGVQAGVSAGCSVVGIIGSFSGEALLAAGAERVFHNLSDQSALDW